MSPVKTLGAIALLAIFSGCADHAAPSATASVSAPAASADTRWLTLAPPPGYCKFDAAEPADAFLLALTQKGIRDIAALMAIWHDCASLAAIRQGKMDFTSPTVVVAELMNRSQEVRISLPRATVLDMVADRLSSVGRDSTVDDALTNDARRRFDDSIGNFAKNLGMSAALQDRKYLGIQARDDNGVYLGMLSSGNAAKQNFHVCTVLAVTELRGRILELSVFADTAGGITVDQLVAKAKEVTARLLTANPEEPGSQI